MTRYARSAERFARDTADHTLTVLHDDGLYRHLRFTSTDNRFYWFELVTWPGRLAFTGGIGAGFVFARLDDMFEFFRTAGMHAGDNPNRIHPGYWAEKVIDGRERCSAYSEEKALGTVGEYIDGWAERYDDLVAGHEAEVRRYEALPRFEQSMRPAPVPPKTVGELREIVANFEADGLTMHEDGARDLLRELERVGLLRDTWEWDLSDWSWEFLWACNAIAWGVRRYDEAKVAVAP